MQRESRITYQEILMTQQIKDQEQNGSLPNIRDLFPTISVCLLTAIIMAGCGGGSTGATSPAANNIVPLNASSDPAVVQTLNNLRQLAATNGSVRVIVGVRVAFTPEGLISASNAALQRDQIAVAQSAVLNQVVSLKQQLATTKLFATIPFMALNVSLYDLNTLAGLIGITSIEEDQLATPSDAQSDSVMGATTAWSGGYSGVGQTIAILDSGVDKTHPFLTGKVLSEACYSSNVASDGATSVCPGGVTQSTAAGSAMPYGGTCPAGACDHGTVVAGIAAGTNATFSGVAKDASLIAIQVFSRFDSVTNCGSTTPCALTYTSDQILGLQQVYALRNTYHIAAVNMSLGSGQYSSQSTCDSANPSIKAAIDILRSVNIPTIIASGNNGYLSSMSAPACISSAISVGATFDVAGYSNNCAGNNLGISSIDAILCESNSASFLNLLAPGAEINSSIPGGGYQAWYGTSMAAPQVAGAWAIMMQKNASLTVTAGLSALISTGVPINDPRNSIVKPRIQINTAVNAI
jgi:subtilisin family serine protease